MKKWVIFDGLPGSGKTTIAKKISEELGFVYRKVEGNELKNLEEGKERCEYILSKVKEAIEKEDYVVWDNLSFPSYEYISGRKESFNTYLKKLKELFDSNEVYVIYFYIDIDPKISRNRKGNELSKFDLEILENSEIFKELLNMQGNYLGNVFYKVDGRKELEEVYEEVKEKILKLL